MLVERYRFDHPPQPKFSRLTLFYTIAQDDLVTEIDTEPWW